MNTKIIPIAALAVIIAFSVNGVVSAHRYNGYGHYNHYRPQYDYNNRYGSYDNHYNAPSAGQDYYGPNADNNNSPDYSGDTKANVDTAQSIKCNERDVCQATSTNVIGNGNTVIVNTNGAGKQQEDYGGPY